jgi:hypothetical protein
MEHAGPMIHTVNREHAGPMIHTVNMEHAGPMHVTEYMEHVDPMMLNIRIGSSVAKLKADMPTFRRTLYSTFQVAHSISMLINFQNTAYESVVYSDYF